jgi:hypothetical protein
LAEVVGGPPCHSLHHRAAPEQEQGRGKLLLPLEEAPPGLIFFPHHLSSSFHPSLLVIISSFFLSLFLLSPTLDLFFISAHSFLQFCHELSRRMFFQVGVHRLFSSFSSRFSPSSFLCFFSHSSFFFR